MDYESRNIGYDGQYTKLDGGGIKCKNSIICGSILPHWWWDCKNNYLCTNCNCLFGYLSVINNVECPICLEVKESICLPRCKHSLCISCFKRCHYGDEMLEKFPIFPYPDEVKYEYFEDPDNTKWNDYPLIKIYEEEYDKYDDEFHEKYNNEEHLRKCPLCRKPFC